MYLIAPDFRFPARRDRLRIASYAIAGVTQQGKEKTSKRVHLLTEIALALGLPGQAPKHAESGLVIPVNGFITGIKQVLDPAK